MKPRKKRIIRSLELNEISAVGKPAMEGALHRITRAAPAEPAPVVKPLLSPELVASIRETEALKALVKSYEKETTMNDITKDYTTLCNHYADKWDVTPDAAGARLMNDRPDLVAKAYETEQAAYTQRQVDKRIATYGS